MLGLLRKPHRGWAIFTMAITGFVLLSQVVIHWMSSGEPKPGTRPLALCATVMFLATFGTLIAVAHTGIPGTDMGDRGSGGNPSDKRNPSGAVTPEAW